MPVKKKAKPRAKGKKDDLVWQGTIVVHKTKEIGRYRADIISKEIGKLFSVELVEEEE